jgi:hypothetical protein
MRGYKKGSGVFLERKAIMKRLPTPFFSPQVVVDRMVWQGRPISFWRVWLHRPEGGYKLIDQGHKKGPIRELAADLAEVLDVLMREIS